MKIQNIDKLIKLMKRIPEEKFDIRYFQDRSQNENMLNEEEILNTCGTTCCISGWIRISKEFKHLHAEEVNCSSAFVTKKVFNRVGYNSSMYPRSIMELLGIDMELALGLIYGDYALYGNYMEGSFCERAIKPRHIVAILEDIKSGILK